MCDFLSWIEKPLKKGTKIYFLTYDQIYNTPRGEILRKQIRSDKPEDFYGHDAIRKYYDLTAGTGGEKECVDFSKPSNFPAVIVKAIKRGEFRGFPMPSGLLTKALDDKYWADRKALSDKYEADRKALDDKYWADRKALSDKYWDLFADLENRNPVWR